MARVYWSRCQKTGVDWRRKCSEFWSQVLDVVKSGSGEKTRVEKRGARGQRPKYIPYFTVGWPRIWQEKVRMTWTLR